MGRPCHTTHLRKLHLQLLALTALEKVPLHVVKSGTQHENRTGRQACLADHPDYADNGNQLLDLGIYLITAYDNDASSGYSAKRGLLSIEEVGYKDQSEVEG